MNIFEMFEANKKSSVAEAWSQKYKSSINCSHPKGFSQKAHCAGKQKQDESVAMEMVCESCGMCETHGNITEIKKGQKDSNGVTKCWPGKHAEGTKKGRNGGQVRNCVPNEGVVEAKHQPRWEVEQRTAGHHSAFYIVRGHSKPREVWKDSRGMSDFRSRAAAEAKAEELNSQQVDEAGGSFMAAGHYNNMIFQQNLNNLGQQLSRLSPEDLEHFNQIAMGIGMGSTAGVAGVIGGYVLGDKFMSLMRRTMSAAKKKAEVDTEEIINLQRQIVSIHKRLKTLKSEPAIAKYQTMLKQAYEVLEELEARQGNRVAEAFQDDGKMDWDAWKQKAKQHGAVKFVDTDNKTIAYDKNSKQVSSITWSSKKKGVAEGKPQKRADRYHINKDGKPASLASYADRESAVKDRDAKYPDAKVHQVGPRGKVKGEFEEGMAENWGEPLTGWHVVYARTGNKVSGTPDFDSRDSAQKYLMTKMSANHHNYRVAHADNLGTSAPTPMGGYLEETDDDDHGYLPTNLKLGAYRDEWDPRDYSAYPDEFKSNEQLREIVYNMVDEGVEPTVEVVFPTILTATQDWLADDRYRDGDPVFEEYEDHPVVLKLDGEYYILDGHHRCSRALAAKRFVKIYMFVAPQGMTEAKHQSKWMSDTELDQYVPDQLFQEWRELLGYNEDGRPHPLWVNMTGGYEPNVRDPQDRANMVKVANKWFAMKRIPNVKFFDVRDADDELEWLVQIGEQGVAEADRNELDDPRVQDALKNMSDRHKNEKWSKEQLAALGRRLAAAGAAQDKKSVKEDAEQLNVGDDVIISGDVQFRGATGVIDSFGRDNRFVVVNLYNHGRHSFHSSDVSYNDYADSDDEQARMYDAGEFRGHTDDDIMESRLQEMRAAGYDIL